MSRSPERMGPRRWSRSRIVLRGRRALGACLPVLLICAAGVSPAIAAVPIANCPLAGQRFSLESPLFDILTHPQAKAAVDRVVPGLLDGLPPPLAGTTLPSLSAILSLRMIAPGSGAVKASAITDALASVPVTVADDRLRCARYDGDPPPRLPAPTGHPAILVFDRSNGFRDEPSVAAAAAALRAMARDLDWQLVFTDRPAVFNRRDLARFDAVVWNNVSGDVLALDQRAAFETYVEKGGGFVGIHGSGGDPVTFWRWYVDTLVGARFKGHPSSPQFQNARVMVDDPRSPITAGLGSGWTMTEEWYSFVTNPRVTGGHVLATLDEASYRPVGLEGDLRMGDHPIAWTRCVGKGRTFYTAIGHLPQSYVEPSAARLLRQGIVWAAMSRKSCPASGRGKP